MRSDERTPRLILLMGVSGTGKTTFGRLLAEALGYAFLDADDFHDDDAIECMRGGSPLSDAARDEWVERLHAALVREYGKRANVVLAFSGLRERHRRRLMDLPFDIRAFMLQASAALLARRLERRQGHFMPASQLHDQLDAMQPIAAEEHIEAIDVDALPRDRAAAMAAIRQRLA